MARLIAMLLVAVATQGVAPAQAPATDPLSSPECAAAREELERALNEPAARRQSGPERLARARARAARICLGREDGQRERSGAPEPAQAVPPPRITAAPAIPPPRIAAPPEPPPAIPRAAVVTTCDPAGCWDSEGRRLNNMGPLLMGPRGLCTLQSGVLNCP
jgi:hypothetical protein